MSAQPEQAGFGAAVRSPGFLRLLIAQAVSSLGDWVATFAFIVGAYALSHRNQTAVAVVLVLRLVPPLFAAPVGGVVADRFSRRMIMVTCDLSRAALVAAVPFVGLGLLYAIAFVHECISLFFLPARDAAVPALVPTPALAEANGLILATSYGSLPVAAALFSGLRLGAAHIPDWIPFGPLFGRHPTAFAFFFDAATFVFSAAIVAGLPLVERRTEQDLTLVRGVLEGARYVLRNATLRALATGLVVSMFGGGVLFAVGIAYIHETLHGSDVDFGWLAALWGAGMGLGLAAIRFLVRGARDRVFAGAVAGCGSILIVMALVPVRWLAFVMAVAFGAAFAVAVVLALTAAQEISEDRMRGRIMGGVQMLFRVGLGAGALGIGALAHAVPRLDLGVAALDGNQLGMVVGGLLILGGAVAATRAGGWR